MIERGRRITLLMALVAAAAGCGTGTGALDADDELDLGVHAARRGYWQEALHRFERAYERDPQDPAVLNDLAVALEATGRYEEALVTYQTALEVDPGNRRIQKNYQQFRSFYEQHVASQEVEPSDTGEGGDDDDAVESEEMTG